MNIARSSVSLLVLDGAHQGRLLSELPLPFLIGRASECHLRPSSEMIDLHHCIIEDRQGRPVIRDLDSGSGTFVNNLRLRTDYPLYDGDELCVGPLRFRVGVDYPIQAVEEPDDDDVLSKLTVDSEEVAQTESVSDSITASSRPLPPPTKVFERLPQMAQVAPTA